MPGVPSSRGCDACRQQKKKCDQAQPSCGRCQRRMIPCVGSGQKRWKFQDQLVRGSSSTTFSQEIVVQQRHTTETSIPAGLTSENARAASALMAIWNISDLRYDVSFYGDYFQFLPRRLGQSPALDAAVRAITCAHPTTYTKAVSAEALSAYGTALRKLGHALNDPAQRYTPNVLCAVHLMQHCQSWISKPGDPLANHTVVMAHLLPQMIAQNWTDPFERFLLILSSVLVVISSTYSMRTPLNASILEPFLNTWRSPRPHTNREGEPLQSLEVHRLVRYPIWCRTPSKYISEMRLSYAQVKSDYAALRARMARLLPSLTQQVGVIVVDVDTHAETLANAWGISMAKLYAQFQAACTLLILMAIFLNALLRAVDDPFDIDADLSAEAIVLMESAIELGNECLYLRPIGSGSMSLVLVLAWGAERDDERRIEVEKMMQNYWLEFFGDEWINGGRWWRNYLERQRLLMAEVRSTGAETQTAQIEQQSEKLFVEVNEECPVGRCAVM